MLALEGGRRGFTLGYKVHTACCANSELPLAFTVQPCNVNEKLCFKPLLEKLKSRGIIFKIVVADAQYDSGRFRKTVREHGAEAVQETSMHRKGFQQSQRVASSKPLKG